MSCDFAENDCWYVTFSGEDEAQEVIGGIYCTIELQYLHRLTGILEKKSEVF